MLKMPGDQHVTVAKRQTPSDPKDEQGGRWRTKCLVLPLEVREALERKRRGQHTQKAKWLGGTQGGVVG